MPRKKAGKPGLYGPLGSTPQAEWPTLVQAFRTMHPTVRADLRKTNPPAYDAMYYADLRERALESFWVFVSEVLENPVLYEPLHKPLCDWAQTWTGSKKMLLLPRGHVKSNVFTVGYAIWQFCKNRDERILIASHKDEDATKFISSIGDTVLYHEKFKCTFPDVRPAMQDNGQARKWSEWRILIERPGNYIEPTVQGTTPRKAAAGQHYSLFIPDDIVTDKNVASEVQLKATEDFHRMGESLLDPGAREFMLGTRYHFEDEYGRILDTPAIERLYDHKEIPATSDPSIVDEIIAGRHKWKREDDFKYLIYPTRYTLDPRGDYRSPDGVESKHRKSIPQIKLLQGALIYANQYMLVPRDPATQPFDTDKLEIVEQLPPLDRNRRYDWYQFCDHASERHTQSKTALVTVAIGPRMVCYVVDLFWGDFTNDQVCEEMFRWQKMPEQFRPKIVGMGRSAYELQLEQYCRERSKELGVAVPFQFVTTIENNEDKNDHIRRLVPFVSREKIKVLASCNNRNQLLHEFDWFPKSKQKDCIDALANLAKIALPGREREFLDDAPAQEPKPKREGMTFNDLFKDMERGGHVRIGQHQMMRKRPLSGKVIVK
jgi:hypothetical protein